MACFPAAAVLQEVFVAESLIVFSSSQSKLARLYYSFKYCSRRRRHQSSAHGQSRRIRAKGGAPPLGKLPSRRGPPILQEKTFLLEATTAAMSIASLLLCLAWPHGSSLSLGLCSFLFFFQSIVVPSALIFYI